MAGGGKEPTGGYTTRVLKREEVGQLHELTWGEKWYCTLEDLEAMYDSQPPAFFGTFNQAGLLVCSCMGYKWEDDYGYISFYITRPSHRGKGLGMNLFRSVMTYLGDRNILLDAVSQVGHLYSKLGFHPSKTEVVILSGYINQTIIREAKSQITIQIRPLDDAVLSDVIKYDTPIHLGINRSNFFHLWVNSRTSHFRAAYNDNGELIGYAMIREEMAYHRVSALYADDETTASALLVSLFEALPDGTPVVFLVPGNNRAATCRVLKTVGIEPEQSDHETRMYTKTDLPLPSPKVFCFLNTSNVLM